MATPSWINRLLGGGTGTGAGAGAGAGGRTDKRVASPPPLPPTDFGERKEVEIVGDDDDVELAYVEQTKSSMPYKPQMILQTRL